MPKVPVSSNEPVAPDLGVLANRAPIREPIIGRAKLNSAPARPTPIVLPIELAMPLKNPVPVSPAVNTLPRAPPIAPPI